MADMVFLKKKQILEVAKRLDLNFHRSEKWTLSEEPHAGWDILIECAHFVDTYFFIQMHCCNQCHFTIIIFQIVIFLLLLSILTYK